MFGIVYRMLPLYGHNFVTPTDQGITSPLKTSYRHNLLITLQMRNTLFCTLLLFGLLAAHGSLAQQNPRGQFGASQEVLEAANDSLIVKLNLASELVPAVRAILAARTESLMALRPESGGGREQFRALRAKREEVDKETEVALSVLLSEEQMTTYRKVMQEQSGPQRPRRGNRQRGF